MLDLGLEDHVEFDDRFLSHRRDRRPARGDRRLRHAVPGAGADRVRRAHLRRSPPAAASSRRRTGTRRTCSPRAPATIVPFDDSAALADAVCRYIDEPERARRGARRGTADRRAARLAVGRRGDRRRPARGRRARAAPAAVGRRLDLQLVDHANRSPAHARRRRRHRPARERRDPEPRRAATASTTSRASPSSRSSSPVAVTSRSGRRSSTARSRSSRTRPTPSAGCGTSWATTAAGSTSRIVGDHVGRSVWALGEILSTAWVPAVVGPTERLLDDDRRHARRPTSSLRTGAYAALGLARLDPDRLEPGGPRAARARARAARRRPTRRTRPTDWRWFEDALTYDNARLPHALIVGGVALGRDDLTETGLDALRWLGDESGLADGIAAADRATTAASRTSPLPAAGDEQPLDASAFVEAELAAFAVTGDPEHGVRAQQCVRLVPRPQPAPPAAVRLRDRRLQRRARRARRRTTTRAPSRRSRSTARRCCSTPPACRPSSADRSAASRAAA